MVTTQFVLSGDDKGWFEDIRAEVAEQRGFEPTANELLRLMMAQVSIESPTRRTA